MKTPTDPRHLRRQTAVNELFTRLFQPKASPKSYLARQVVKHQGGLDKKISIAAPQRPIAKINRIDLAILRLATFELQYRKRTPPKVVLDEAVELAKQYGSDSSPSFVNGVLGTILKKIKN